MVSSKSGLHVLSIVFDGNASIRICLWHIAVKLLGRDVDAGAELPKLPAAYDEAALSVEPPRILLPNNQLEGEAVGDLVTVFVYRDSEDRPIATKQLPTAERLAFMKDVFDVRGMMSGMSLTKDVKELDAFLAKLKDVSGQADATAKAMDAGVGGSFRLFRSAVEGAMNATGEALNSTIKPMVERITAVINSFTKWIEANRGLVTSIAVTAGSIAALGAALLAIGGVQGRCHPRDGRNGATSCRPEPPDRQPCKADRGGARPHGQR